MYIRNADVSSVQSTNTNQTTKAQETENDISIFNNDSVDETDFGSDLLNAIVMGILNDVFSDTSFTKDEAKTYVEGEKELAEIIKNEKDSRGFFDLLFNSSNIEKECREKYESEHPEYAKVAEEGQKVQKQYDDALANAKEAWLNENPQPENITENGGLFGIKRTDEYKQWSSDLESFIKDFESEYKKKDPDYKILSDEQNKDKSYADELAADLFSILIDEAI